MAAFSTFLRFLKWKMDGKWKMENAHRMGHRKGGVQVASFFAAHTFRWICLS
jgi:hypothetical protein